MSWRVIFTVISPHQRNCTSARNSGAKGCHIENPEDLGEKLETLLACGVIEEVGEEGSSGELEGAEVEEPAVGEIVVWDGNGPIRIFRNGFKAVTEQLQVSLKSNRVHACVFTRCTAAMWGIRVSTP